MSQPFDRNSDGMVLGEGAGAVILESLEHAQARGAKLWGEIIGFGAAHVGASASPDHLWKAASAAMSQALRSSQDRHPAKWHVHAHGIGIPHSDEAEAQALNEVLRGSDSVPVTAAKSYFGNLGAGSAAVELICSLLALDRQQLFPIRNLKAPLESIRWQPARADSSPGQAVMHNSFTQQGQAASLVVALP